MSTVEARRAQLDSQVAEPVITAGMTKAERRAEMDRYLDDHQAQHEWLDEEHRLWLGDDRSAAIYMTHELVWEWENATADRWFRALPERYMTPDSLAYPDWDHSHYEHDENGHIGRVTTKQRTLTAEDIAQRDMVKAILADLDKEEVA